MGTVIKTHQTHMHTGTVVIGDRPQFMTPQHPNVYVYENNSVGERQNLVLLCSLMNTTNVTYQWFRSEGNQLVMVRAEMVNQVGTLTVYNITEGDYASRDGVKYYCVASRNIGKGNYVASVRSRTITVFYACKCHVSKVHCTAECSSLGIMPFMTSRPFVDCSTVLKWGFILELCFVI